MLPYVFINMVTHLSAERVKTLVSEGIGFAAAVNQAENDLLRELHITSDDYRPSVAGVSMDVTGGDTGDNAYLLAVSSVLIQVALLREGSLDAALQELLNSYTLDLADDGALEQRRRDAVATAFASLQVDAVQLHLEQRLADLGSADAVPDMRRVLDQIRCCQQGTAYAACRDVSPGVPPCDAGLECAAGLSLRRSCGLLLAGRWPRTTVCHVRFGLDRLQRYRRVRCGAGMSTRRCRGVCRADKTPHF
jgi:hypothetical protein